MAVDLKTATIRMYEDISLTEDLTDEPAQALLKWGENQLGALATKHDADPESNEESFEDAFKTLRRIMKQVNKIVANDANMDADTARERLTRLIERAQELGLPVSTEKVDAFLEKKDAANDNSGKVAMLTGLLEKGEVPDPPGTATGFQPDHQA